MDSDVLEYLDSIKGVKMLRSGTMPMWFVNPSVYETQWKELTRENACVYDFVSTSSLVKYLLLQTSELSYRKDGAPANGNFASLRIKFLSIDSRILHQLIFHDKIYLNITNDIKERINWEVLEAYGIAAEYPRPRSKEYIGAYKELKPLLMTYVQKLLQKDPRIHLKKIWKPWVKMEAVGSLNRYLSFLFDEYAKYRCGEISYFYDLLDVLTDEANFEIGDIFEAILDGFSPMIQDSMSMFTLIPYISKKPVLESAAKSHVRDDTFVLFQHALGDEMGVCPRAETLADVLRLREHSEIQRFRELFSELHKAIKQSDSSLTEQIKREIIAAKKRCKQIKFMDSRAYLWATTALGFIPIIGQILGGVNVLLYEAKELIKKKNNWIYLGLRG